MIIKTAHSSDIEEIVSIHVNALPQAFLPQLGHVFLRKYFYPLILNENFSDCYVLEHHNLIQAFIVITSNHKLFYKNIFSQISLFKIASHIFLQGIRKPNFFFRSIQCFMQYQRNTSITRY